MALVPFPGPQPSPDPSETPRDRNDEDSTEPVDQTSEVAGAKMSFLDHLDELRKRLVISLCSILVGILVAFAFIKYIFEFIMRPLQEILPNDGRLVFTEPTEAFFLYMKVAALAGLIIAFPVVAGQTWLFIAPGLYSREKRLRFPSSHWPPFSSSEVRCFRTSCCFRGHGGFSPGSPRITWTFYPGFNQPSRFT